MLLNVKVITAAVRLLEIGIVMVTTFEALPVITALLELAPTIIDALVNLVSPKAAGKVTCR